MQLIDAATVETPPVDLFHIRCFHEPAAVMPAPHRHDDLEVVLVGGTEPVYYEHLGRLVPLLPGRATAFWAAYPHTLARRSSGAVLHRLMVPIGLLLSRGLPEPLVVGLLAGNVLSADVDPPAVEAKFRQWEIDAASGIAEARQAMVLEIDGWLRRMSAELSDSASTPARSRVGLSVHSTAVVASMCRYIVRHFHEPIRVADVTSAAKVAPQYGMTLFHSVTGLPVAEYLNRCRVAEAQRLLLASEANISDVAFAAGFGSVSQFYDRFASSCGTTPRRFRLDRRS
jgi:AraC-like DNA-binding protein